MYERVSTLLYVSVSSEVKDQSNHTRLLLWRSTVTSLSFGPVLLNRTAFNAMITLRLLSWAYMVALHAVGNLLPYILLMHALLLLIDGALKTGWVSRSTEMFSSLRFWVSLGWAVWFKAFQRCFHFCLKFFLSLFLSLGSCFGPVI